MWFGEEDVGGFEVVVDYGLVWRSVGWGWRGGGEAAVLEDAEGGGEGFENCPEHAIGDFSGRSNFLLVGFLLLSEEEEKEQEEEEEDEKGWEGLTC